MELAVASDHYHSIVTRGCMEDGGDVVDPEAEAVDLAQRLGNAERLGRDGNGLRGLGLRLLGQGYSTPFLAIGPAYSYQDYNQAKQALAEVGAQIARGGLPAAVSPLVTTICGTGNVSKGAVDALGALGDVLR